jgi:hypothetical protein
MYLSYPTFLVLEVALNKFERAEEDAYLVMLASIQISFINQQVVYSKEVSTYASVSHK